MSRAAALDCGPERARAIPATAVLDRIDEGQLHEIFGDGAVGHGFDDHDESGVLELGAGYANFINNIRCRARTAVDVWPALPQHVRSGVTAHVGPATDLAFLLDASVDFVFASNLFEHLTQAEFADVLAQLGSKMRRGATLNILQPNYRRAYREYFDDYTHVTVPCSSMRGTNA